MFKYNRAYIRFYSTNIKSKTQFEESRFFPVDSLFWDELVKIGSKHLLLPAIYASLERKELHENIPLELKNYLREFII